MTKMLVAVLTAVLSVISLCGSSEAWNPFGHMAVAYVAYQQLTPATRARVKTLLKKNPYAKKIWPSIVAKGPANADKDLMTFMVAATWPDQIKSDGSYTSDGSNDGNIAPTDGSADRNVGYKDHARHKYWHFIDEPFSRDGTALPPVPAPNAEDRIATLRAVLASATEKDSLKSYDLSWLLHLVGDVHQPLHCTTRISASDADGDDGGNGVAVSCSKCPSKLHAFWDGSLAKGEDLATVIKIAAALPKANAAAAAISAEKDWVKESFDAAKNVVYQPPVGPGSGPFALTPAYRATAKTLAKERIALAGARLANLLNNQLK